MNPKEKLRRQLRQQLHGLDPRLRAAWDAAIAVGLEELAAVTTADIVMLYAPMREEVRLQLPAVWRGDGRALAYPRIEADGRLTIWAVDKPESQLMPGVMGILEPDPAACMTVPLAAIDLILVPGLAFDRRGNRLGRGKGYYDRLLGQPDCTAMTVSVCYPPQLVDAVPVDAHDRPVDLVVTPGHTYRR